MSSPVTRWEATLSSSIVIHVLRPYANEEEYLAHESHTIDAKSMLLLDQPPLPVDSAVIFDVQLQNGQKPIRAEAKVIGSVAANGDNTAGLRVRFKRFGAATKAFIDRALALSAARGVSVVEGAVSRGPASLAPSSRGSSPEAASDRREPSGIHRRPNGPVMAPANREELLERLRERARAKSSQVDVNANERAS